MLAVLELADYGIIALIVMFFAGGGATAYSYYKSADGVRLRRIEAKIDFLLKRQGLEYEEAIAIGLSDEVMALADGSAKLLAIKLHREQTGLSLVQAKSEIDAYISGHKKERQLPGG